MTPEKSTVMKTEEIIVATPAMSSILIWKNTSPNRAPVICMYT